MLKRALPLLLSVFLVHQIATAQSGAWTWVQGPDTTGSAAVYGTQGAPNTANNPPALYEAANWIDTSGNFWIYGGLDQQDEENDDLWMYNPQAGAWTWVQGPGMPLQPAVYGTIGIPSPTNSPGCRAWGAFTWTDANGDLWLYGGANSQGAYGDMWRYNIASNEWTWMAGIDIMNFPALYQQQGVPGLFNMPGNRQEGTSCWKDANNNLWLFGGRIWNNAGNDVWQFNVSTNEWTWVTGPLGTGSPGNYGILGVPSPGNLPPARSCYTNWQDGYGNFYIFGGVNLGNNAHYSDVWKYDITQGIWTWIGGESTINFTGNYNDFCITNGNTGPWARYENRTAQIFTCNSSVLLSFGGSNTSLLPMSDMWIFNTRNYQWTWVNGTNTPGDSGSYGIQGVPNSNNLPPARSGMSMWMDHNSNIWVFGGWGYYGSFFADIWKYTPDLSCVNISLHGGISATPGQNIICYGDSTLLTITGASPVSITPAATTHFIDSAHYMLLPDTTTTYLITGASVCNAHDTAYVTLGVTRPGRLGYTLTDTNLCRGNSDILNFMGQSGVTIAPLTGVILHDSTFMYLQPPVTTAYTLQSSNAVCGGNDSAKFTIHVIPHDTVLINLPHTGVCLNHEVYVSISGLTNISVTGLDAVSVIASGDTATVDFYANYAGPDTEYISGTTSCGGPYIDTLYLVWVNSDSINYRVSQTNLCTGDTAVVTVFANSGTYIEPADSVTWIDSAHVLLYPSVSTVYKLHGYNAACGVADSVAITVRVIQPGVVNYLLSPAVVCSNIGGTVGQLYIYGLQDITITPPASQLYYVNADTTNAVAYFDLDSTSTYVVSGRSVCGGNVSTTITIPVLPGSTILVGNTNICLGDSVKVGLVNIASPVISPGTGVWWADTATIWITPVADSIEYTISGAGCGGVYTQQIDFTLYRDTLPVTAGAGQICQGDSTQLCAQSGYTNYRWSDGQTGACIEARATGNYYVTATGPQGCIAVSLPVNISVTNSAPVNITEHGDTLFVNTTGTVQWYRNGQAIPGATGNAYIFTQLGSYTVTVQDVNCGPVTSPVFIISGINVINDDNISVYPNPSTGSWYLTVSNNLAGGRLKVFDAEGRLVSEAPVTANTTEISVLSSGVYLLQITSDNKTAVRKLVKL